VGGSVGEKRKRGYLEAINGGKKYLAGFFPTSPVIISLIFHIYNHVEKKSL